MNGEHYFYFWVHDSEQREGSVCFIFSHHIGAICKIVPQKMLDRLILYVFLLNIEKINFHRRCKVIYS